MLEYPWREKINNETLRTLYGLKQRWNLNEMCDDQIIFKSRLGVLVLREIEVDSDHTQDLIGVGHAGVIGKRVAQRYYKVQGKRRNKENQ